MGGDKAAAEFLKSVNPSAAWPRLTIPSFNYYPRVRLDNSMSPYGRRLEPVLKKIGQPYILQVQGNLNDLRSPSKDSADLVNEIILFLRRTRPTSH